jgi:predicted enzyme related to lactoylglutathione lyase
MAKHAVCHIEWSSTDLQRTETFLSGLFDWKFSHWGDDYLVFNTPDGPNGGIMKVDKVEPGRSPYVYINVEDIEPYLKRAEELGGEVDVPKTEIPKVGWYAHIKDHEGNIIGLLQGLGKK